MSDIRTKLFFYLPQDAKRRHDCFMLTYSSLTTPGGLHSSEAGERVQQHFVKPVLSIDSGKGGIASGLPVQEDDSVVSPDERLLCGRLKNAEALCHLSSLFAYLSVEHCAELLLLLKTICVCLVMCQLAHM